MTRINEGGMSQNSDGYQDVKPTRIRIREDEKPSIHCERDSMSQTIGWWETNTSIGEAPVALSHRPKASEHSGEVKGPYRMLGNAHVYVSESNGNAR